MIQFILLQNRKGRPRLAKYYAPLEESEKHKVKYEVHHLVVIRDPKFTNFVEDGRRVHVIERDFTESDRIVSELLQPGGYLKLIELGLEDYVDSIDAQRVLGYAIFKDGKVPKLSYPLEKYHSDVAGRSFHNGRLIQRIREKAASLPNVQLEKGTVTSLIEENGIVKGVTYN